VTEVRLHKPLDTILSILNDIRSAGYVQGADFDFAYYKTTWDPMVGDIPSSTIFTFYTEELSLMFALKYGT
jgi:hypothetical protein